MLLNWRSAWWSERNFFNLFYNFFESLKMYYGHLINNWNWSLGYAFNPKNMMQYTNFFEITKGTSNKVWTFRQTFVALSEYMNFNSMLFWIQQFINYTEFILYDVANIFLNWNIDFGSVCTVASRYIALLQRRWTKKGTAAAHWHCYMY